MNGSEKERTLSCKMKAVKQTVIKSVNDEQRKAEGTEQGRATKPPFKLCGTQERTTKSQSGFDRNDTRGI